jgi:hypothetical protein
MADCDADLRVEIGRLNVEVARLQEQVKGDARALSLSRDELNSWKLSQNEWRQENVDQRALYITTDRAEAMIKGEAALRAGLEGRVYALERAEVSHRGRGEGYSNSWIIGFGVLVLAVQIVLHFVK